MELVFKVLMTIAFVLVMTDRLCQNFKSFERMVLYFILQTHSEYQFKLLFKREVETVESFISKRPELDWRITSSFYLEDIRVLLRKIEGFDRDKYKFAKLQQYQKATEAREERDKYIKELYIALDSPQL